MLISTISSGFSAGLVFRTCPGLFLGSRWDLTSRRSYAKPAVTGIAGLGKKKLGKAGPVIEKRVLPVETDPVKLVNYCCGSNINKEGEDIKLGEDSEYPDWLWTLNTGPPLPLEKMDPDTQEYWDRVIIMFKRRKTHLQKFKKL